MGYKHRQIHQCRCGIKFANDLELRVHVGLLTPDWPKARCTSEHHNPRNVFDLAYLKRKALMEEKTQDDDSQAEDNG